MAVKNVKDSVTKYLNNYFEEQPGSIVIPPQLESFRPEENALLYPLWRTQYVPEREARSQQPGFLSKSRPFLLLHGLDNAGAEFSQPAACAHIEEAQFCTPSFLYGTSGAGKTRTVFEYLSKNKGFYFLADDFARNPGSMDLVNALKCTPPLIRVSKNDTETSDANRTRIFRRVSMLLFIRYAVHEKLEDLFKEHFKREMTPYEWLLYQIFPERYLGEDLFYEALLNCDVDGVEGEISFQMLKKPSVVWSIFVDEAQALLDKDERYFLSKCGEKHRSAFSALMGGFGELPKTFRYLHFPVFCGTGLPFDQLSEQTQSIVGKASDVAANICFSDFKLLGVEQVERYLRGILDLSSVDSDVVKHVANWLRGRPRWTATFLEVYSSRKEKSSADQEWRTQGKFKGNNAKLMEGLDRYLNIMTRKEESNANRREAWSAGRTSAYACFERVSSKMAGAAEDQRKLLTNVEADLEYTVWRFAVGQNVHPFINHDAKFLIESGVAAVCETERAGGMIKGHIDEPIVIQSGINFFNLDIFLQKNLVRQERGGQGPAFEKLLLPGLLMEKDRLREFIKNNLGNDGASSFEPYGVSRKSAYGVFCVETESIDRTLEWLKKSIDAKFEGQVAPFCYPDVHMGPDVVFLLRKLKEYTNFRSCVLQSKYESETNNQQEALRTIVPKKFYLQSGGKEKEQLSVQMNDKQKQEWGDLEKRLVNSERPCLRLLVQTPAKTTAAAVSGRVHADGTGPMSNNNEGKKRNWLIVVDKDNAGELFSNKSKDVVHLLKKRKGSEA